MLPAPCTSAMARRWIRPRPSRGRRESFIFEPAKTWHYLFTKTEPVEVEIRGIGPRANIVAK